MTNLGRLYNAQRKYTEAEEILARALSRPERASFRGFHRNRRSRCAGRIPRLDAASDVIASAIPSCSRPIASCKRSGRRRRPAARRAADALVEVYEKTARTGMAKTWRDAGPREAERAPSNVKPTTAGLPAAQLRTPQHELAAGHRSPRLRHPRLEMSRPPTTTTASWSGFTRRR